MSSRPVVYLLAAAFAAFTSGETWAQMDMSGHSMGTENQTPPSELPVPRKITGIGNAHLKITANRQAQKWFDQGLNLIHDFWDYESARAFEQAVRVDPKCAMCYWGLYKAENFYHGNSQDYAAPALATAVKLKGNASERERLYIEATAAYEEGMAKNENKAAAYRQRQQLLRQLVREYPKDTQGQILLASAIGGKEQLEILESVLKTHPDDSAANHYYIHALESSPHPEKALHSAEILGRLAPASGHMVHMPGHIFFRLGDYARAEEAFAASLKADEHYMLEQHVQPDDDWNYVHNLMYAVANLLEEGKFKEATAVSSKLTGARGVLESTLYIYSARDSISRLDPRLPVALRTGDWAQVAELAKASAQPPEHPKLVFLAHQLVTFGTGMQAVEAHDLGKAEESSTQFDAELKRMSEVSKNPSRMPAMSGDKLPAGPPKRQLKADALLQPIVTVLSIMAMELRGTLLTAQGKAAEAKTVFGKATQAEKALGYHEPPNYIRPVAETIAAAMISAGDWTAARTAFEQALVERPRSGLVLYGIALCREKAGDAEAAAKGYADFLASWKDADPDLPQMAHAKSYLAGHR